MQQYEADEENNKWKRMMDRDSEKHYSIKLKKRRDQ